MREYNFERENKNMNILPIDKRKKYLALSIGPKIHRNMFKYFELNCSLFLNEIIYSFVPFWSYSLYFGYA